MEEQRLQRIRQVKMEDRRTVDRMLQEQRSGSGSRGYFVRYYLIYRAYTGLFQELGTSRFAFLDLITSL